MDAFEARLREVDPRLRSTRVSFYHALMDWTYPVVDGELPSLRRLLAESDRSESTFRDHFGIDRYPELQPCAGRQISGVERVVMEAKTLTVDSFVRGYREIVARLHQPPQVRFESLTAATAAWALEFRALSAMLPARLPDSITSAARALAGTGPRSDATFDEICAVLAAAVENTRSRSAEARPAEVLSGLRHRMVGVFPIEDDLLRASRELASHVGEFMVMSADSRAEVDPQLRFVLQRAVRMLRRDPDGEQAPGE